MKPIVFIFAKAPQLGRAKTRLAADIGTVHALRLYRAMTAQIIRTVQDPRWHTVLSVTPPHMVGRVPEWRSLEQIPQVRGSLSPRLADVFSSKGSVIAIGTDCPQVRPLDIATAVKALRTHDAVLGPADDGGFWLIGMNGPVDPSIFDGIRWSHSDTLADMEANISGRVHRLRTLIDVDDLKALNAVRRTVTI